MPPWKLTASPTITVGMPNWRTRPLQNQQGASVVTMILSRALTTGTAESIGFSVDCGVVLLNTAVVAPAYQFSLTIEESGADRNAAFREALARFLDGDFQHMFEVGLIRLRLSHAVSLAPYWDALLPG
jgi:hypothetical protein